MTFGIAESALSKMIEPWEENLPSDIHLAYLPNPLTGVRLRLSIYGGERHMQEARIEKETSSLKEILGDAIWSEKDDTFEELICRVLSGAGKTLSTAESCTGGKISSLLTSVPRSSA